MLGCREISLAFIPPVNHRETKSNSSRTSIAWPAISSNSRNYWSENQIFNPARTRLQRLDHSEYELVETQSVNAQTRS